MFTRDEIDESDAQPHPSVNLHRRKARDRSEILGAIRGIVADGYVGDQEIIFLGKWLLTNSEFLETWPFNRLMSRIGDILADGRIDEDERESLHELMLEITGRALETFENKSTTFPLTRPMPQVVFDSNEFVLTGKFIYGTRKVCESEILSRGGSCCDRVTLRTSYVVIGDLSSRDWISTSWGRKIELAAKYAETHPVHIVSEKHWAGHILAG